MSQNRSTIEAAGKDVDAAIAAGLARLGVPRDAVDVEVLDEGRQGMFGLGARAARVRLKVTDERMREGEPKKTHQAEPPARQEPPRQAAPTPPPQVEQKAPEPQAPTEAVSVEEELGEEEQRIETARRVTRGLLDAMGLREARVEIERAEPGPSDEEVPPLVVDVKGPETELLIGPDGEVLNAFQYILRLLVGRQMEEWVHVVVDVKGYKAQRANRLRDLAHRMADQAVDTDRCVILQPMPPNERRVVHVALYEDSRVTTESIYEGERRRVTIVPKE